MKIILSRKGFDSANGGIVSPIFEDGTMVSFPIPSDDEDTYDSLYYNGIQYSQILRDLQYKGGDHCHLDPDLDLGRRRERIDGWFPAFGQRNAAAAYLKNIGVAQGDIFLFFGNFHFVEYQNGTYRYLRDRSDFYRGKDLQVIWGYLQVGEIISVPEEQRKVWWHPHSSSMTIAFSANEEILNTDESVATFCEKLEMIIDQHSFINQLEPQQHLRDICCRGDDDQQIYPQKSWPNRQRADQLSASPGRAEGEVRKERIRLFSDCRPIDSFSMICIWRVVSNLFR